MAPRSDGVGRELARAEEQAGGELPPRDRPSGSRSPSHAPSARITGPVDRGSRACRARLSARRSELPCVVPLGYRPCATGPSPRRGPTCPGSRGAGRRAIRRTRRAAGRQRRRRRQRPAVVDGATPRRPGGAGGAGRRATSSSATPTRACVDFHALGAGRRRVLPLLAAGRGRPRLVAPARGRLRRAQAAAAGPGTSRWHAQADRRRPLRHRPALILRRLSPSQVAICAARRLRPLPVGCGSRR